MTAQHTGTAGGTMLRTLREQTQRTQLWVEAEANLGSGYLQRVECGRVAQPERATLERILAALDARFAQRREILATFGYAVRVMPPSVAEHAWARAVCAAELGEAAFPVYVLDCAHRLVAFNASVPPLFAISPDDPTLGDLVGRSLLAAWFDPGSPLAPLVAEPEVLLPALIRALRYEMQQFAAVLRHLHAHPRFRRHWATVEREPAPASAMRTLTPVRLNVPGAGALTFRISAEPLLLDARFRIISYVPADPQTLRVCAAWTNERTRSGTSTRHLPSDGGND